MQYIFVFEQTSTAVVPVECPPDSLCIFMPQFCEVVAIFIHKYHSYACV
jgi:hypothetical protein